LHLSLGPLKLLERLLSLIEHDLTQGELESQCLHLVGKNRRYSELLVHLELCENQMMKRGETTAISHGHNLRSLGLPRN
jgi:hypothetical protein